MTSRFLFGSEAVILGATEAQKVPVRKLSVSSWPDSDGNSRLR
jgi:hypothetical protein